MSKDLNKVRIIGRLGKDPEARYTPQGSPLTRFSVAAGRRWRTPEGEDRDETEWFNVVAWNKLGETCAQYLHKGSRVYIEGRLQTRNWDDQTTGQKRYMTEVIANDMIMLDSRRDSMGGGAPGYDEPDVAYQESEPAPEVPARQSAQGAAPHAAQPARPVSNGQPQRTPQPSGGSRRPAAPQTDDEDLPF